MPGTPPAFAEEIVDRAVRVRPRPFRVREKVPWEEKNLIPIPRAAIKGTGLFSGKWPLSVIFPMPPMHLGGDARRRAGRRGARGPRHGVGPVRIG